MDTWTTPDLPVLRAFVEHFTHSNEYVRSHEYAALVPDFDEETVLGAVRRLARANPPYFEHGGAAFEEDESGVPWAVFGVTERAMREVGQWPSAEQIVRRIAEGLLAAAEKEPDLEAADRARKVASWVATLASGTGSGVAAAALARAFGVG